MILALKPLIYFSDFIQLEGIFASRNMSRSVSEDVEKRWPSKEEGEIDDDVDDVSVAKGDDKENEEIKEKEHRDGKEIGSDEVEDKDDDDEEEMEEGEVDEKAVIAAMSHQDAMTRFKDGLAEIIIVSNTLSHCWNTGSMYRLVTGNM